MAGGSAVGAPAATSGAAAPLQFIREASRPTRCNGWRLSRGEDVADQDESVGEIHLASQDEAHNAFKLFQSVYAPPAFIRRAIAVEAALEELMGKAGQKRDEW